MKKKPHLLFLAVLLIVAIGYILKQNYPKNYSPENQDSQTALPDPSPSELAQTQPASVQSSSTPLPATALLEVPFVVQAPFANWDPLHEEACEEASILMLQYFKNGIGSPSNQDNEQSLTGLVSYEEKNGYDVSITLKELNTIAQDYFKLDTGRIEANLSIVDIKNEINSGRPVIVGAAGKLLNNPHFTNGGPNYHMLVIIGYDQNGFITNDPGTKYGENYHYDYNTLYTAIHDWSPGDILQGSKNYLVFN